MAEKLLEVKHLKKYFLTKKGLLHAVDDINLHIYKRETLGLVGESGCGKSTTGKLVIKLLEATEGEILFEGKDIRKVNPRGMKEYRQKMQIVFQDPYSSLDPRRTIFESIEEPLRVAKIFSNKNDITDRVHDLMKTVGLAERLINAYPHELDGGRRQRVGVARALAVNPSFIVLDEPVSALDVSIQAQVLNLLQKLQSDLGLAYMFISHDLSVVKHISDRIAVMYLGVIVELADYKSIFADPMHPYTQALLSAVPNPRIDIKRERVILEGDVTSPIDPPEGCRFYNRCKYKKPICREKTPELRQLKQGHFVSCHFADSSLS